MARTVGEETIILDLSRGEYYGLDHIGARIWGLIAEGVSIFEICATMNKEYDVDLVRLEEDILELVDKLFQRGLIDRI